MSSLILKFLAIWCLLKLLMFLQELSKTVAKLAEDGKVLSQILSFHLSHYVFASNSNITFLSSYFEIF
jgi:hypothetical protein